MKQIDLFEQLVVAGWATFDAYLISVWYAGHCDGFKINLA